MTNDVGPVHHASFNLDVYQYQGVGDNELWIFRKCGTWEYEPCICEDAEFEPKLRHLGTYTNLSVAREVGEKAIQKIQDTYSVHGDGIAAEYHSPW